MQLNETFYHYNMHQQSRDPSPFPWPTPDQFEATVAWPGDETDFEMRVWGVMKELKMTTWLTCWTSSLNEAEVYDRGRQNL